MRVSLATACFLFLVMSGSSASPASPAAGNDDQHRPIADAALSEARELILNELFGHYDITRLDVLQVGPVPARAALGQDYALATVTMAFAAKRNATRHPNLNAAMFEPNSPMCQDWLYLHCGVPVGYVFEGKVQFLLAEDRLGSWRIVPAHWNSMRQYSLDGYLLLEGRTKEGYVLFPAQPDAQHR